MRLGLVSCIGEVVCAFFGGVGSEQFAHRGGEGFDCSGGSFAQEMLELGEDLLDWVQVRRIFGQEEELGAGRPATLCEPRLSMITRSPGLRVGASTFST